MKSTKILSVIALCCAFSVATPTVLQPVVQVSAKSKKEVPRLYIGEDYLVNTYRIYDYIKEYKGALGVVAFSHTAKDYRCPETDAIVNSIEVPDCIDADKAVAAVLYKYGKRLHVNYKKAKFLGISEYSSNDRFKYYRVKMGKKVLNLVWGRERFKNRSAAWASVEVKLRPLYYSIESDDSILQQEEERKYNAFEDARLEKISKIDPNSTITVPTSDYETAVVNEQEYKRETTRRLSNQRFYDRPPVVLPIIGSIEQRLCEYEQLYGNLFEIAAPTESFDDYDNVADDFADDFAFECRKAFQSPNTVMASLREYGFQHNLRTSFAKLLPEDEDYKNDPLKRRKILLDGVTLEVTIGWDYTKGKGVVFMCAENDREDHIKYIYEQQAVFSN